MISTISRMLPADLRSRTRSYAVYVVAGIALRAVGTVLLVPLVRELFGPSPADAWPWVAALTGATLLGWFVDSRAASVGYDISFGLLNDAQRTIADRLTRIRMDWFTADHTRDARQAIAATGPDLVGLFAYLITPLTGALLLPFAIAIALLFVSVPLGLVALACCPILLAAYWSSIAISRGADRVASDSNAQLTERLLEFARTQEALRASRRVEPARSHAGAALAAQHGAGMRLLLMQVPGQLIFSVASQLALIALAGTTGLLAFRGTLSIPEAVAMIVVIARFLEPFSALSELAGGIERTSGLLRQIRSVLDAPLTPSGDSATPREAAPRLELRDVTFGYSDGEPILEKFDLTLEPGSTTAIIGPSGSGKSTVLSLLAGLQVPQSGAVLVDDVDVASLQDTDALALRSVGFQHPYLVDGTILDNVRAGNPGASERQVHDAMGLARVDELTARLPDGERSIVGEGGAALSGGERQRVSIARALLKPAPVLLVDEATSALDTENERAVVRALTSDPHPRTRVVVAHRLASIRAADRVVFLDGGRIVEDGGVDELLAAGGRFATFWREQEGAAHWQLGTP